MMGDVMNQSSVASKIYSILQNEPQVQATESITNYLQYHSTNMTPDLLELVWNRANDGMALTDSDGILVAVNDAFSAFVKMEHRDLIGSPFTVIYDPMIDRDGLMHEFREKIRTNNFAVTTEQNILLRHGDCVFVELSTSVLVDDAQEMFILTAYRDISERKRWEQTLHESEKRFRNLFENSVLPMYQSSKEGRFINANPALIAMLGYGSLQELQQLSLERDVYAHPAQRIALLQRLREGDTNEPATLELKKKDGTVISVLAHSTILQDDNGTVTGFEGVLEDITERKELERRIQAYITKLETAREELLKLNAQKDKILAVVSHDLRSPFGSILGFCDILKTEFHTLSEKEKLEYVDYINDAATQQLTMVNSLLDWSRLETGRVRLRTANVNLAVVVKEVLASLLGLAKKKSIELLSTVPPHAAVKADEQLVRQLFSNLVGNALKFTPHGGLITVSLKEDDEHVVVSVTDSGIGIPAEDLPKLFRIEEKYSRQGLQGEIGTGLGLPMCHEIMKKHNGFIEATSTEGTGTTFTVRFPKQTAAVCKKVLIVDDQKGNRMILARFMKRISPDAETIFAGTGKEALESIARDLPDLIITDYHMPTMDGLEFIRRIRNSDRIKHTPVILISGDDMEFHVQLDTLTEVLRKPVIFNQLKDIMDRITL